MGANAIEIYRNNSKTIVCTVSGLDDLDGYTAVMTVKVNKDDTEAVIEKEGDVVGLVITFEFTPAETDILHRSYQYDVVITSAANEYTIIQDTFRISKSVSN